MPSSGQWCGEQRALASCSAPLPGLAWIVFFCRAGYLLPTDIAASTHPPTYPSRNASHEAPTHPQAAEHRPRRCRNKWRVLALAGPLRPRRLIVRVVPAPPSRGRPLIGPTHGPDSDGAALASRRPVAPRHRPNSHDLVQAQARNMIAHHRGAKNASSSFAPQAGLFPSS